MGSWLCVMEGSEMKSSPICPAVVTYCAANEIPQQPCPCLLTAKPEPVKRALQLANRIYPRLVRG